MLETALQGEILEEKVYEARVPALRVDLLNAQFDLKSRKDAGLVVLLTGDDGEGCDGLFDRLHEWMDARQIDAGVFPATFSEEERLHPPFWRFWQALPKKGRTGIFFGGWVSQPLMRHLARESGKGEFVRAMAHVRALEQALVADGTAILKLWVHNPGKERRKALKKFKRKSPLREDDLDLDFRLFERLNAARPKIEQFLEGTHSAEAPWVVLDGRDACTRDFTGARAVLAALQRRLDEAPTHPEPAADNGKTGEFRQGALDLVDLSVQVPDEEYEARLAPLKARLAHLSRKARRKKQASVLVFEGWDAAGKGGTIRRLTSALSARYVKVVTIGAPSEEELAHHYLWRFWRQVPRAGHMTIFDRSWYGRVLVERVEGFATEAQWRRAYEEINDFEAQLVESGVALAKFWMHIDADEQERRFSARALTDFKKYKLTDEDKRNSSKRDAYVEAVNEMVERTSTPAAPWNLVPANDKRYARLAVFERVCDVLDARG